MALWLLLLLASGQEGGEVPLTHQGDTYHGDTSSYLTSLDYGESHLLLGGRDGMVRLGLPGLHQLEVGLQGTSGEVRFYMMICL